MKAQAKVKIPAKINLTLDVSQKKDGYHEIKSLVASIGIFDEIILKRRKDDLVRLTEKGLTAGCEQSENNAYKCYKLLQKEYSLGGVDILVNKNIPVGAGLGGSSADIAGVILATESLYDIKVDRKKIADNLGSDVMYMTVGSFAVISGRGNEVESLGIKKQLFLNVINNQTVVKAKDSYNLFDERKEFCDSVTESAVTLLRNDDDRFYKTIKNDLQSASIVLAPVVEETLNAIEKADGKMMTGSGSAVFGIYKDKKTRDIENKFLTARYGKRVIKTETI